MTLSGGKDNCHGTYTRQTLIKFTCDHSTDGKDGPKFIGKCVFVAYHHINFLTVSVGIF